MEDALLSPFRRLLENISTPLAVRKAETADPAGVWEELTRSGFLDALVPERDGGAGLQPGDVASLLLAGGRALLPAPFGETMVARAIAARAGANLPATAPILLWPAGADGRLRSNLAPLKNGATHALIQRGECISLCALADGVAEPDGYGLGAAAIDGAAQPLVSFNSEPDCLLRWSATLAAVNMSGAMTAVLDMTLAYVDNREQFGRKLGQFQAVQNQLAVAAEHVAAACIAARSALVRPWPGPQALDAAAAKIAANDAAKIVCAAAHAAHGAIGVTAEHDLQLFVRRIKRWRASYGSAHFWAERVGQACLSQSACAGDFIRAQFAA